MDVEKSLNVDSARHQSDLLNSLNESRREGGDADFRINVGEVAIAAHRNVLSASSKYFRAMLKHDTKENRQGYMDIQDHDAEVPVRKCIDFIYTGKASISQTGVVQLMHYATMFQLHDLIAGISHLLNETLCPGSFFHTKHLADTYDCESLAEKCDNFAFKHFKAISELEDFLELQEKYVLLLIGSSDTKAAEVTKFRAFLKWINHRYDERKGVFLKMLKSINVENVPSIYRRFVVENEPLVYENAECLRLFLISFFETVEIGAREITNATDSFIAVFDQVSNAIKSYDPASNSWEKIQDVDANLVRNAFAAVMLEEDIYILLEDLTVHKLLYLNSSAKWEQVASMKRNHGTYVNAVVMGGMIYVVGTWGALDNSVERYDPQDNSWSDFTSKTQNHCNTSLVVAVGRLYSIGGWNGLPLDNLYSSYYENHHGDGQVYTSIEWVGPDATTWTESTEMGIARHSSSAVSHANIIYVMGGNNLNQDLADVEQYNIDSDSWTTIAPMLSRRSHGFRALVVRGDIFVLGSSSQDIEKLDLEKNEWTVVGNMSGLTPVNGAFLAVAI